MIRNFAAIDIGSNAIRLLIKSIDIGNNPKIIDRVLLLRTPIRLGEDVFASGIVSTNKCRMLECIMASFRSLMDAYDVYAYRACATSAMRDAGNGNEIMAQIKKVANIDIEIISGAEEATLVYNSHIQDMLDRSESYLYVDLGGGSVEINLIVKGEQILSKTYNLGTVRAILGLISDSDFKRLKSDLIDIHERYGKVKIIGSGGNINKLHALSLIDKKNQAELKVKSLRKLYDNMRVMTKEERAEQYGLKMDRADVIVPAAELFLYVAKYSGAETIIVPKVGIADGIINMLMKMN